MGELVRPALVYLSTVGKEVASMIRFTPLLFGVFVISAAAGTAVADITGPNGEKCDSTESQVKHDINGKHYICDKCVILSCDTSTTQMKDCKKTTHWVNCTEAQQ
jgi:hypothetical protein